MPAAVNSTIQTSTSGWGNTVDKKKGALTAVAGMKPIEFLEGLSKWNHVRINSEALRRDTLHEGKPDKALGHILALAENRQFFTREVPR